MSTSPDSLIARAEARRDAALAEARRWEEWLHAARELDVARAPTRPEMAAQRAPEPPTEPSAFDEAEKLSGDAVGERVLSTQAEAVKILVEMGKPVPTRQMLEEMTRRGFLVGGKDPMATLITRLNRAPKLENHKPFGWRLKEPRQEIGAVGSAPVGTDPTDSDPENPNDAERRGEVAHDKMTT